MQRKKKVREEKSEKTANTRLSAETENRRWRLISRSIIEFPLVFVRS